jgi:protein-S-isoprenylcysteine O-methyltransferase Ste14
MLDSGLLGIVLLINIGLAVACGIQMISAVFEVRREARSSRQASINSALVCGLYLVLLGVLAVLYWVTASQKAAQVPLEYSRETLFGWFITVMLFLACLSLLPTLLVGLGAVRSTER